MFPDCVLNHAVLIGYFESMAGLVSEFPRGGGEVVGIEDPLRDQGETSCDGGMPLDEVFEGVKIREVEGVGAVEGVEPGVEKVFCEGGVGVWGAGV